MLTLYWGSGSPFAWRVMLALAVKKMDYEGKLISFSSGELSTPEYLAMSPRGQVPLITDGDYSLTESLAIMQYLEARDSSVAIFGKTAQETGDIWRSIQLSGGYIEKSVFDVAKTIFKGQLDEQRDTVIEARKILEVELSRIDEELSATGYLVGGSVSAADLSLYPLLQYMSRAINKTDEDVAGTLYKFPGNFSNIAKWNANIESIEGYDDTYPPHWKQ